MGITIVQKSDLKHPKPNPKIALVLSGGGLSGGAFKVGGLLALSSFMSNRRLRDFDIYVGASAGAILCTYLANGVSSKDMAISLEGGSGGRLNPIKAWDFYYPNVSAFLGIPSHILGHLLAAIPKGVWDVVVRRNVFRKRFRDLLMKAVTHPTYKNVGDFVGYCLRGEAVDERPPSWLWHYIPNALFTTDRFEAANRKNMEDHDLCNDFRTLYETRGKALYIVAMNLDCAQRVVFGHDEIHHVPISKAMQASIAIPFFYKPVTIDGTDYVDGAVIKTTSIDLAVAKGADLIIVYNPFRPFNLDLYCEQCEKNRNRVRIVEDGIYALFNQVMRTVLHTRLMHGIELYRRNPDFKSDIILVEPTEYDAQFFDMNPMGFWERRAAAKRGYESVREAISENYKTLKKILNAYGIKTRQEFAHAQTEKTPSVIAPDAEVQPPPSSGLRGRRRGPRLPRLEGQPSNTCNILIGKNAVHP